MEIRGNETALLERRGDLPLMTLVLIKLNKIRFDMMMRSLPASVLIGSRVRIARGAPFFGSEVIPDDPRLAYNQIEYFAIIYSDC